MLNPSRSASRPSTRFRITTASARVRLSLGPKRYVPENAWYESYVATLANAGVVSGYDEYRFGPNDNVTRAEFVTMLVRLLDKKTTSDERIDKVFTDVKADAWYSESVQTAYSMGWIHGYEDHRAAPG